MDDNNIFDISTIIKSRKEVEEFSNQYELDNKAWNRIKSIIDSDIQDNNEKKRNTVAVFLGLSEYGVITRICTRAQGRHIAPTTLNNIPLYLIPVESFCAAVPQADQFWQDFNG